MTWTVICTNNAGIIIAHYVYGSNDRRNAWQMACDQYGTFANPLGGFYVITIIPGRHPVYGRNTTQSDELIEMY